MDGKGRNLKNKSKNMNDNSNIEDEMDLRRGPWTVEEDFKLINYIASHGEGRWNSLARLAGLKRTGKSCRLRWLNYLRPDVRRGNITLEEQLLILELHSHWGNRWSKIAQYLPGRTDNEIKNYWRTRVQKHAKQLKCDVNSKQFKDTMRYLWMPRLVERIQAAAANASATSATTTTAGATIPSSCTTSDQFMAYGVDSSNNKNNNIGYDAVQYGYHQNPNCYTTPENSSVAVSPTSDLTEYYSVDPVNDPNPNPNPGYYPAGDVMGQMVNNYYTRWENNNLVGPPLSENYFDYNGLVDEDLQMMEQQSNLWFETGGSSDNLWNIDAVDQDFLFLQQLNNNVSF